MKFTLYVQNTKEIKDSLQRSLGAVTDGGIKLVSLGTGKFVEFDGSTIYEPLALRCSGTPKVFMEVRNACREQNKVEPVKGWYYDGFSVEKVFKGL